MIEYGMLTRLIEFIPEDLLPVWFRWLTSFSLLVFPILIGLCGFIAWKISDRMAHLKEMSHQKIEDGLQASLTRTQRDLYQSRLSTEEVRAHAVRLEEKQAPWLLSQDQKDAFTAYLKGAAKGKVALEFIQSDQKRAFDFASAISELLKAAGYVVWGYIPPFEQKDGPPLSGIQIQFNPQSREAGEAIQRAFKTIGYEAAKADRMNHDYPDDYVVIRIGVKS